MARFVSAGAQGSDKETSVSAVDRLEGVPVLGAPSSPDLSSVLGLGGFRPSGVWTARRTGPVGPGRAGVK